MSRHRRHLLVILLTATVVGTAIGVSRMADSGPGTQEPSGVDIQSAGDAASDPPVILPGRPGEPAEVRPGSDVVIDPPQYNAVDTWYVQMMIPHHDQAVRMASLAAGRTDNPAVVAFADRIRAGQSAELDVLRGWLQDRGLPAGTHDHATMPGMQTSEAIRRLAAARDGEFDRRFVEMMSAHHQGAIDMSTRVLQAGSDLAVEELATAIAAEQAVEVDRMRDMIAS
ncbi:DUF305 domain-containing protein [Solwaraspora sp. WMMD406]|uniref:DUF305 domain-containing protein n=1 Tax=Solwaraspora sp. WMMD406 TaxID=3016095 RepID=UPI002416A4BF|nr:DUF305 domain-containing protein [Solwaraspora sp. WMMD406]MDG4766284.1 DUF305 domain-containing protein [Solwaraspora sp. WMMD406]